jgi:hypothetical protein
VDGLYGLDDFLLWPQLYNETFCHLACIPYRPQTGTFYFEHLWMWEKLERNNIDWEIQSVSTSTQPLGTLAYFISARCRKALDFAVKLLPPKGPALESWQLPNLYMSISETLLTRLERVPSDWNTILIYWREMQRAWLSLVAWIDYTVNVKPRMCGKVPEVAKHEHDVIGVFTISALTTEFYKRAGILVFFIQPIRELRTQCVQEILPIVSSSKHIKMDIQPSSTIVYDGPAMSPLIFHQLLRVAEELSHSIQPSPHQNTGTFVLSTTISSADASTPAHNRERYMTTVPMQTRRSLPSKSTHAKRKSVAPNTSNTASQGKSIVKCIILKTS